MNRFTADGLIQEALDGKKVVVLSQTASIGHGEFRDVLERCEHHGLEHNRWFSSGRERVAFGTAGSIHFLSIQANLQGHAADIVYVGHIWDRSLLERVYCRGDLHSIVRFTNGELVVE